MNLIKVCYLGKIRKNAEKDFYKLMNESVFGKTIENIKNHKSIRKSRVAFKSS